MDTGKKSLWQRKGSDAAHWLSHRGNSRSVESIYDGLLIYLIVAFIDKCLPTSAVWDYVDRNEKNTLPHLPWHSGISIHVSWNYARHPDKTFQNQIPLWRKEATFPVRGGCKKDDWNSVNNYELLQYTGEWVAIEKSEIKFLSEMRLQRVANLLNGRLKKPFHGWERNKMPCLKTIW